MAISVTPAVMRRLMREISDLKSNPPEGIRIATNDDNMLDVTGIIEGPESTPYASGYFKIKFKFTEEFPAAPPKCWFATKIFHPNVSSAGEICVNTLKKDWVASYGIKDILITVKCLLIHPNPESALDEEAGKLLLEDYESYCERARLITSVHATPRVRPKEFDTPAAKVQEAAGPSKIASPTLALPPQAAATAKSSASTPIPKSPSPQVQSQPLQTTTSNTLPSSQPNATSKEKEKERHTSPTPLSTADANVSGNVKTASSTVVNGSKAVKRTAQGMGGTGIEKRKKALKRL